MSMKIQDNAVVSIHYKLTDDAGNTLDESGESEPMIYFHGAGQIVPGLEKALTGKSEGDTLQVTVGPDEGYGEVIPGLVMTVDKGAFKGVEKVEVGMVFQSQASDGTIKHFMVKKVDGEIVTVDGNHPYAGMTLHFDIAVVGVREATEEEIKSSQGN